MVKYICGAVLAALWMLGVGVDAFAQDEETADTIRIRKEAMEAVWGEDSTETPQKPEDVTSIDKPALELKDVMKEAKKPKRATREELPGKAVPWEKRTIKVRGILKSRPLATEKTSEPAAFDLMIDASSLPGTATEGVKGSVLRVTSKPSLDLKKYLGKLVMVRGTWVDQQHLLVDRIYEVGPGALRSLAPETAGTPPPPLSYSELQAQSSTKQAKPVSTRAKNATTQSVSSTEIIPPDAAAK
jgi:hypothetical protein